VPLAPRGDFAKHGAAMPEIAAAFRTAAALLASADPALVEIVLLSMQVSLSALALAALVGLPLGAALGVARFPGRRALVVLLNAGMGLPPVVVGLVTYLVLSRSGPLGALGLLFTPTAMVIAQALLIAPILVSLTRQVVEDLFEEYSDEIRSVGAGTLRAVPTLLWDGRFRLVTVLLAGFGRASAEVGAVIIVGGNIAHVTRVMTTAIALETSRGDLALALALGGVLLVLSLAVNAAATLSGDVARALEGAA
jgi:tungstate transport system permease protein